MLMRNIKITGRSTLKNLPNRALHISVNQKFFDKVEWAYPYTGKFHSFDKLKILINSNFDKLKFDKLKFDKLKFW